MTTVDLRKQRVTLDELLALATSESVHILTGDGEEFILEAASEYEREVETLGKSEKFMRFLAERSNEPGYKSIQEFDDPKSE